MNIERLKEKVFAQQKWVRAIIMLLFLVILSVVKIGVWCITAFQLVVVLLSDKPNNNLLKFSHSLGIYAFQIIKFLTYDSDERPWPFTAWPAAKDKDEIKVY